MIIRIGEGLEALEEFEDQKVSIDTGGQLTTLWGTVVVGIKVDKGFFVVTADGNDIIVQRGEKVVFTTEGEPGGVDGFPPPDDSVDIG